MKVNPLAVALCGALLPVQALAYLDPGTGSLILQGLIAAFLSTAAVVRFYWYRIRTWFRRLRQGGAKEPGVARNPKAPHE